MTNERDPLLDEPAFGDLHDQLLAAAARRAAEKAAATDAPATAPPDETTDETTDDPAVVTPIRSGGGGRSRRPLLVAAAAIVATVTASVALSIALSSPDVAADVTVQRNGDRVRVVLEDEVTVEDVRAAMEREGLDVVVRSQVTGPSKWNRFIGNVSPADASPVPSASAVTEFRVGSRVTLFLGVQGAPGATYEAPTDATGPGEVLDGIPVIGRPIDEVVPILDGLTSVEVTYEGVAGRSPTPPAEGTVTFVIASADDAIRAYVL